MCKPESGFYQDLLCAGDQRYCARYIQIDERIRSVSELDSGIASLSKQPRRAIWSDTSITWMHPIQNQSWPNGKLAYRIETTEILDRFTGQLTRSTRTTDAAGKHLTKEAANQIVQALGGAVTAIPLNQIETFQCKEVERRL